MRHALIRFLTLLDVDAAWYARILILSTSCSFHTIAQVCSEPLAKRLPDDQKQPQHSPRRCRAGPPSDRRSKGRLRCLDPQEWAALDSRRRTAGSWRRRRCLYRLVTFPTSVRNANHVLDDPQMPGLIPLIRKIRPELPIVYRSHIEIRSDLVQKPGSPQEEVWQYLWKNIQLADLFISKSTISSPMTLTDLFQVTLSANSSRRVCLLRELLSWGPQLIGEHFRVNVA